MSFGAKIDPRVAGAAGRKSFARTKSAPRDSRVVRDLKGVT